MMNVADRLEDALEKGSEVIVVRCAALGDLVKKWIGYGNAIKQTASLMSVASLAVGSFKYRKLSLAFAVGGFAIRGIHGFMWGRDPLANYTLYPNESIPPGIESKSSELILFRKEPGYFTVNTVLTGCALAVGAYFFWKLTKMP